MTKDEFLDLKKKAESGDRDSMLSLGFAYHEGEGVEKDLEKAFEWTKRAAKAGEPQAMFNLSVAYKHGEGTATDIRESFEWTKRAAKAGHHEAMYNLSLAYGNGEGTEENAGEAFEWTKKAAEAGDPKAMHILALNYYEGEGVEKDEKKFFEWAEKAAEAGNASAMYIVSIAYKDGTGTEEDFSKFFEWSKKAAEKGVPVAMYNLSILYLGGIGTEENLGKYYDWIRKAAAKKHSEGIILSGLEDLGIEDELSGLVPSLVKLYRAVQEKKEEHVVKDNDLEKKEKKEKKKKERKGIAHFTDLKAAKSILMLEKENHNEMPSKQMNFVRLYNVSYVNDPQEGKRLIEVAKKKRRAFKHFFSSDGEENEGKEKPLDHHIMLGGIEYSVYIGSFTLRTDSLDLWRAYGRDGKGFCIVSPLSAFQQEKGIDSGMMIKHAGVGKDDKGPAVKTEKGMNRLYKVKYTDTDAEKTLKYLDEPLKEIKKACDGFKGENKKRNKGIVKARVRAILSEILYLYKSKEYSTEKEARMISAHTISDDRLKLDERTPSRLYLESAPLFFEKAGSEIIIGPKVKHKVEAMMELRYRLTNSGWEKNTAVEMSSVQYR
jgi:TPR repeat protein